MDKLELKMTQVGHQILLSNSSSSCTVLGSSKCRKLVFKPFSKGIVKSGK